jgi:hypothetical protein
VVALRPQLRTTPLVSADTGRIQQLETNLQQMSVALDEANGRISRLQAAKEVAEASAAAAAPSASSLPQPPNIALRGDSVRSLEAQVKAPGTDLLPFLHPAY